MGFASALAPFLPDGPELAALASSRRRGLIALALLPLWGCQPAVPTPPATPPMIVGRLDPRLAPLREASARWSARLGPVRRVVDQVALVPDVPSFFRAIREWNREQFFPILIETDVESTLRFVRAFHPARVVRLTSDAVVPPTPDALWRVAGASVAASWRGPAGDKAIRPDDIASDPRPPRDLGPTPPGVVVSAPEAPMLAGAVALAAGHFEPLVRFDSPGRFHQKLTGDEFRAFDHDLSATVAQAVPIYQGLGDDCDFLTVAAEYPYRYRDEKGEDEAVDDAIARDPATGERWAFAGRLLGDPARSVARAMASLFLQPESALLFNGYDESAPPWSVYATRNSAQRLASLLPTQHQAGPNLGTVAAWSEAFDPENRAGLVWINSHDSPTVFHLRDEPASTLEIPRTVPAAVVMIHSYSASDPTDPGTIAGRWLANGAFVYFGSVNEPYLQAFRTPELALELALDGIPLVAYLRATTLEPYGQPWRLVFLGDPLYRLQRRPLGILRNFPPGPGGPAPSGDFPDRIPPSPTPADWAIAARTDQPQAIRPTPTDATAALAAAWDQALAAALCPGNDHTEPALLDAIAQASRVDRDRLVLADRCRLDSIRADLLFRANRRGELRTRIEAIPPTERSPEICRWHDALRASDLAWLLSGGNLNRLLPAWDRLVGSDALAASQVHATARVGAQARDVEDRRAWAGALRQALERPLAPEVATALRRELDRIEGIVPAVASGR